MTLFFHFQALARAPSFHVRPTALKRPPQNPHTEQRGEGTSSNAPPTRGPSGSDSNALAGRLAAPPDLLTRCWLPSSELSRQFLTLDTSLEPTFILDASIYVSSSSFGIPFFSLMI